MENNRFDGDANDLNRMKAAIPTLDARLTDVETAITGAVSSLQTANDTLESVLQGGDTQ